MKRANSILAACIGLGVIAAAAPASAEERVCTGWIGAITLDNVRVPSWATCRLVGTRVKGTVLVQRSGALVTSRALIIGNIQGEGARNLVIGGATRIGGSVQLVQGGAARIAGSVIDGSIQLESNTRALAVLNNTVGADVQAFSNRGGVEISDNRVDGNLQCKSNVPAPTGGDNIVQGNKEDQCSRL